MLSLCMIVKNEEDNLDRCLKSIYDIVDQIVIVDTGSTDSTVNIAKKYTNEIYSYEWDNDFSAARNFSISKATGDWILILDADDEVPEEYKDKILELTKNKNVDGYFFKTVSFIIAPINDKDVIVNSNFRLFQNKELYRYKGRIHEQLAAVIKEVNPDAILKTEDIEINHYGYLEENVNKKQKRKRNMEILKEEIKDNPDDPFNMYNLASEYYAIGNYTDAIPLYLKAVEKCDYHLAYYTKIITRLVLSYNRLKLYDEAYKYINLGINNYPNLSDFYYLRAKINLKLSKPTLAINDLEKCLRLGEPPQELAFLEGSGSYRAANLLVTTFYSLGDYEKCIKYCLKLMKFDNKNLNNIYTLTHCMYKLNYSKSSICRTLEQIFSYEFNSHIATIAHMLAGEKDYNLALQYCDIAIPDKILYLKGFCNFKLKNFKKSIELFSQIKSDSYKETVLMFDFMSYYKLGLKADIESLLNSDNNKTLQVCSALYLLLNNEEPEVLTEDEFLSKEYCNIIFKILDILLEFEDFDDFEKSLQLLNLITDDSVLLRLGKLYFKYNKYNLAKNELLRSISLMNVLDEEGTEILNKLYNMRI